MERVPRDPGADAVDLAGRLLLPLTLLAQLASVPQFVLAQGEEDLSVAKTLRPTPRLTTLSVSLPHQRLLYRGRRQFRLEVADQKRPLCALPLGEAFLQWTEMWLQTRVGMLCRD